LIALAYVLLLAIVSLSVPLALRFGARVNAEVRSQARSQADVVAAIAANLLGPPVSRENLRVIVRSAAPSVGGRVTVVDGSGVVLADSQDQAVIGTNYATVGRPEVVSALRRGVLFQNERYSSTLHQYILATAVPIERKGDTRTIGAVRITQSVSAIHDAVRQTILEVGLIGLVVLALGLSAGAFVAGQIARPLRRLERVARQIASGDLTARAAVEGSSEQRSLGESFNEMTDRIVRLLDSQRDFVADASHQLRTPLTGLRLRLDEARAAGVSGDAARELDAGAAEVDRFAQIIDELLVLSRAGERELPGERLELDDVGARALERWRKIADARDIALAHVPGGCGGVVWCARADADRALDALIENALRYAPSGSTVTIAVQPAAIEVLDAGPGLAADERELVFERFHRGRAGRTGGPGTGLGLAIARELAREWGGDVTLENRRAGGAVATLRFEEPA
jgi:two-component system, OmpR family, sensor kinase